MSRWLVTLACLLSTTAVAHEPPSHEQGLLQFRADATELLYELSFPKGPESSRWRLRGDLDRNGTLDAGEWTTLSQSLGASVARSVTLRFEGVPVAFEVVDTKISAEDGGNGYEGRFRALVRLRTRPLPAGPRPVEVSVRPLVDRRRPVVLRFEVDGRFISLVGGRTTGDGSSVKLAAGETCSARVDVQPPIP